MVHTTGIQGADPAPAAVQERPRAASASLIAGVVTAAARSRPAISKTFPYWRHRVENGVALALSDSIALISAVMIAGWIRSLFMDGVHVSEASWFILPIWLVGVWLLGLLPSWGLGPVEELRRLTILLMAAFAAQTVVLFLSKQGSEQSRLSLSLAFCLSMLVVPWMRTKTKKLMISAGRWGVPAVIYGAGESGARAIQFLQAEKGLGFTPVGVFDDGAVRWHSEFEQVEVMGTTNMVAPEAPVAILAIRDVGHARAFDLIERLISHYRTVVLLPDMAEMPSVWVWPRDMNGMLGLEIRCNLTSRLARIAKRTIDLLMVLVSAVFWIPLCGVVALLIWLEDGQGPFYTQVRVGRYGRSFTALKFRTMVPDAEAVLQRRLREDSALRYEWETTYKLRNDPRITRIGRFLRRFSIDELPQLVNVLRGEMSLVGPRPLPHYHHIELSNRVRDLREHVRPGLTGLWQVSGRSDIGTEGMGQWDAYYVRNWSVWLDTVILIRTLRAVLKGSGAY